MTKIFLILLFISTNSFSQTIEKREPTYKKDFFESVNYLLHGSYKQFTTKSNLFYAGAGVPAIWYSFDNDKRIQNRYKNTKIKNIVDHVGDAGVILNFPLIPLGFYYLGRKTNNNKHIEFAKEYMAAMYLTLIETGLLSHISVHERPDTGNLSFWEKSFRGDSSWPSGHVAPYMTLTFKTMQFYGPYYALIPLGLSVMAGVQRIKDNKHWLSDIITTFFLSAWASEGVRSAANGSYAHPFYKRLFEHKVSLGVISNENGDLGPSVSWVF